MKLRTEKLTIETSGELDAGDATTVDLSGCATFLVPMIATESLPAAAGVEGMVVYDTTANKLLVSTGSAWETITSGS